MHGGKKMPAGNKSGLRKSVVGSALKESSRKGSSVFVSNIPRFEKGQSQPQLGPENEYLLQKDGYIKSYADLEK